MQGPSRPARPPRDGAAAAPRATPGTDPDTPLDARAFLAVDKGGRVVRLGMGRRRRRTGSL